MSSHSINHVDSFVFFVTVRNGVLVNVRTATFHISDNDECYDIFDIDNPYGDSCEMARWTSLAVQAVRLNEKHALLSSGCTICLHPIKHGTELTELDCHHKFHPACFKSYQDFQLEEQQVAFESQLSECLTPPSSITPIVINCPQCHDASQAKLKSKARSVEAEKEAPCGIKRKYDAMTQLKGCENVRVEIMQNQAISTNDTNITDFQQQHDEKMQKLEHDISRSTRSDH